MVFFHLHSRKISVPSLSRRDDGVASMSFFLLGGISLEFDVIPCGNHWNITERSKQGHSLFNLQSISYMIFACSISNYSVSVFHLMNHAFFKALLFMSAGSVNISFNVIVH